MARRDPLPPHLAATKQSEVDSGKGAGASPLPALTLAYHPRPERVGDRAVLYDLEPAGACALSRLEPEFAAPDGSRRSGLDDSGFSRTPVRLARLADGAVRIERGPEDMRVVVDGVAVADRLDIAQNAWRAGTVIELARCGVMVLHPAPTEPGAPASDDGMVGASLAMGQLRQEIGWVGARHAPVLVSGEPGTGKELVARSIHDRSSRRAGPYVTVHVGAIPAATAAAQLFGHVTGALGPSIEGQTGTFVQADGGTLLLDELGAASAEVQMLLLRALAAGQAQPVGAGTPRTVDARVVAATDCDLDAAVRAGEFELKLLHRLTLRIVVPPLRDRRDDIGRLLVFFLRRQPGAALRLDALAAQAEPWLDPRVMARLAQAPWPGNVRQLENVAQHLGKLLARGERVGVDATLEALLDSPAASRRAVAPEPPAVLTIGPDLRWFEPPAGGRVDLTRRGPVRLVLRALLERRRQAPNRPLTADEVLAAGWPGEKLIARAASSRVHTALWTLRKLGLGEVLLTAADGYLLDPGVQVAEDPA